MKVHFISIGGSVMHNLAIALSQKGYHVSGSDDEIFEPSRSRLKSYGLLPDKDGWRAERIHQGLDAVILGMHAKNDNPELLKARELGLKLYSFPEYLYEHSKEKKRVVIGGSHGKTTITSMILHALKSSGRDVDFIVGAHIPGFDVMARMTEEADYMVFEGDEYLSSALDPRPKFHLYMPHIALLSGIAWDHMNVFPSWENYVDQFDKFVDMIEPGGKLFYAGNDDELVALIKRKENVEAQPYFAYPHSIENGNTFLLFENKKIPVEIFGQHNMMNLAGAMEVCRTMGLPEKDFVNSMESFKGANRRLQKIFSGDGIDVFNDFAHAPSKLKATITAMREQYPDRRIMACLELHTYSSLNREFLPQYNGSVANADIALVYYNPHTLQLKRLPDLNTGFVKEAFGQGNISVLTDSAEMRKSILKNFRKDDILLMMSSGNFDGMDFEEIGTELEGLL